MDTATVRVRPLRFAFVVEPKDKAGLQRIFEINSALWGGIFNFIVPLFKQVPPRYREKYFKTISATAMLKGLVEAFQPDYLVELEPGAAAAHGIAFPEKRIVAVDDVTARDERKRCKIGTDLRSICDDLYRTAFRFVQRHPPEVVIPSPTEKRFRLLFAATFGFLPESGPLADVSDIFLKALEGKRTVIKAVEFPTLFGHKYYYPLQATHHELDTFRNSWEIDSKLFYMDETSPWDLIEFWNLRALGWHIEPLPASLAPDLIDYCNDFIKTVYRPFPPPSNAYHHATMLCARSQSVEKLQEFMKKLTWVPNPNGLFTCLFLIAKRDCPPINRSPLAFGDSANCKVNNTSVWKKAFSMRITILALTNLICYAHLGEKIKLKPQSMVPNVCTCIPAPNLFTKYWEYTCEPRSSLSTYLGGVGTERRSR